MIDESKPIPFYGDGSTARDYTFISDITNGIKCALNNLKGYRLYNLGESRVVYLSELVGMIEKYLGKKAIINHLPLQSGDVNITYADISRAKHEIGYDPKFSFEQGVEEFIKWYSVIKK